MYSETIYCMDTGLSFSVEKSIANNRVYVRFSRYGISAEANLAAKDALALANLIYEFAGDAGNLPNPNQQSLALVQLEAA